MSYSRFDRRLLKNLSQLFPPVPELLLQRFVPLHGQMASADSEVAKKYPETLRKKIL